MGQGVPQGRLAGVRVLIADDDNVYRSYVRRMLETGADMNVVAEAVDGEEAVTLSRLLKPDLVLMDLDLPRLHGLQATRRLKAEVPKTRVIILSTVGDETCRRAAEKYGADAFLPKGTDIARLLSLIRKVTERAPQDNRLAGQT